MKFFILCVLAVSVTSHLSPEGCSGPLAEALAGSETTSDRGLGEVHSSLRREKRCSCSNMQDTECVYFCHVGIVWVNTPGQVVPYGLGNPLKRRKRKLSRCFCTKSSDAKCWNFCQSPTRVLRHTRDMKIGTFRKAAGKRTRRALNKGGPGGTSWEPES